MEESTFNKLQYSVFKGADQFVVRSNDKAEFMDLVAFIDDFVAKLPKKEPVVEQAPTLPHVAPPSDLGVCKFCGSPNKWSVNKNKKYCSAMCWKKNPKYGTA